MDSVTVVCPREFDIAHAAEFKARLTEVPSDSDVIVDASRVSRIDAAGVQLLLAFITHLRASGRRWSWAGRADAFLRAVEELDLAERFEPGGGES